MTFDIKHVFLLGWPVLSVLLLFSVVCLAVLLQCWALKSRLQRLLSQGLPPDAAALAGPLELMERRLALLGTIANASPFVGLLGTVLGIIRAFHSISLNTGGGISTVAGGISEALVSTAAGLAVAIPASMVYNYFTYHHGRLARQAGLS